MALRKRKNTWYAYFNDLDGRRIERSLHTTDDSAAKMLYAQFMGAIAAKRNLVTVARMYPDGETKAPQSLAPEPVQQGKGGLITLAKMPEIAARKRKLSPSALRIWRLFVSRIAPKQYAKDITAKAALDYLEQFYGTRGNGKTYNNVKSALNTIFRCCLVEIGISSSPFQPIINRRVTAVVSHRNLTDTEIAHIMEVAPLHIQVMVMLSRWTCQRLETCFRITPEMFDFERKVFIIRPGKTARFNKWVCIPVMPELERFIRPLLPQCKPNTPIIESFTKFHICWYRNRFTPWLHSIGINDTADGKASFHSLRGSAITWFKEHGIQGETLRAITGHSSDKVEDIYARDIATISAVAKRFAEAEKQQ